LMSWKDSAVDYGRSLATMKISVPILSLISQKPF
jgi:hypothetical protein